MSPLSLLLLRRAALYALVLAVLLLTVPRLLTAFGVIGPSLAEEVSSVEATLRAAQAYGARPGDPAFARASQALERARGAADRSERWQAKRAIVEARGAAIEAQRTALARNEEARRRAQKLVLETDRRVNEIEDLYAEASRGLDRTRAAELLGQMKAARASAAALWLAFEEKAYERVIAEEPAVREVLSATGQAFRAARRTPPSPR